MEWDGRRKAAVISTWNRLIFLRFSFFHFFLSLSPRVSLLVSLLSFLILSFFVSRFLSLSISSFYSDSLLNSIAQITSFSLSLSFSPGSCSRGVNHPWSGTIYLRDNSLVRVVRFYINLSTRCLSRNRLFVHGNNGRSFCGIVLRNNCHRILISIYCG